MKQNLFFNDTYALGVIGLDILNYPFNGKKILISNKKCKEILDHLRPI